MFHDSNYFVSAFTVYLSLGQSVELPLGQFWSCTLIVNMIFTAMLCSTILILNMTFDRFYSIVRPHKAASFNTVKRAKITIACAVVMSLLLNIPHWFLTWHDEWLCLPYGNRVKMDNWYSQFYYWFSFAIQYAIPFVSLLSMNGVIIYTLRNRMKPVKGQEVTAGNQGQGEGQGQNLKMKSSEMQIYIILLLVTFGFLILNTPAYLFFLLNLVYDFTKSPKVFASFHMFVNAAQKMNFANHGINFFLYVISGQKFRTDLKNLFGIKGSEQTI